jgi:hypothetical protein
MNLKSACCIEKTVPYSLLESYQVDEMKRINAEKQIPSWTVSIHSHQVLFLFWIVPQLVKHFSLRLPK